MVGLVSYLCHCRMLAVQVVLQHCFCHAPGNGKIPTFNSEWNADLLCSLLNVFVNLCVKHMVNTLVTWF